MPTYLLYLESGPRHKTTMVHVLDLLGCIARGPTTEAALANTHDAIRQYLGFLRYCGEPLDPDQPFDTTIAAHVMEGSWIGYGDPAPGFDPDFQPLTSSDQELFIRRLGWLNQGLLSLVKELSPAQLTAQPEGRGRTLFAILQHVVDSQYVYLRYQIGKVPGMSEALKEIKKDPHFVVPSLDNYWELLLNRWLALTPEERKQKVPHGQTLWTARRGLRRSLEHGWEHLLEVSERLEVPLY
jgi:predicted RNase H-like HicB family nuclease